LISGLFLKMLQRRTLKTEPLNKLSKKKYATMNQMVFPVSCIIQESLSAGSFGIKTRKDLFGITPHATNVESVYAVMPVIIPQPSAVLHPCF